MTTQVNRGVKAATPRGEEHPPDPDVAVHADGGRRMYVNPSEPPTGKRVGDLRHV